MIERGAVAVIDEKHCIGCTLCINACPVDAILGAAGLMHTVIEDHCIGCDLCVAPCPVDCITMIAKPREWKDADSGAARLRAKQRKARLAARKRTPGVPAQQRKATMKMAIERVRARRAASGS